MLSCGVIEKPITKMLGETNLWWVNTKALDVIVFGRKPNHLWEYKRIVRILDKHTRYLLSFYFYIQIFLDSLSFSVLWFVSTIRSTAFFLVYLLVCKGRLMSFSEVSVISGELIHLIQQLRPHVLSAGLLKWPPSEISPRESNNCIQATFNISGRDRIQRHLEMCPLCGILFIRPYWVSSIPWHCPSEWGDSHLS